MKAVRSVLLGLAFVLVFGVADGAVRGGKAKKKGKAPAPLLVSREILDQLNLTDSQSQLVAPLQMEFARRVKEEQRKIGPDLAKAKADKDKAATRKISASLRLAINQVRQSMEPRFVAILTPAQKKKYADLKMNMPAQGKAGPARAPENVKGTIQRLNAGQGTLIMTVNGSQQTYLISRATKALDAAGGELPDGLADKALTPGTEVSLTITKSGGRSQRSSVLEIKLASK